MKNEPAWSIGEGMSLRDWFAGKAMQGMCANSDVSLAGAKAGVTPTKMRNDIAFSAYKMADDMLKQREIEGE